MFKVISSALLPALLCVWFATTLASSEKNWSRADALQEAYESYSLNAAAGELTGGIFSTCLTAARTIDAKLSSIEIDGTEYVRFVPDAARVAAVPITYTDAPGTPPVTTFAECAAAAKLAGAKMFKYSMGFSCKFSQLTGYDMNAPTVCEDTKQDAVFIRKN